MARASNNGGSAGWWAQWGPTVLPVLASVGLAVFAVAGDWGNTSARVEALEAEVARLRDADGKIEQSLRQVEQSTATQLRDLTRTIYEGLDRIRSRSDRGRSER
jgi:hypothetical protein